MTFDVEFTPAAHKEINKLDKSVRPRLYAAIELLQQNPFPPAAVRLTNRSEFRIRVGDYRILYEVEDQKLISVVVRVAHRSVVYRENK